MAHIVMANIVIAHIGMAYVVMANRTQTSKHYSGAILNYKKDATPFWNFLRMMPLMDRGGDTCFFIGVQVCTRAHTCACTQTCIVR